MQPVPTLPIHGNGSSTRTDDSCGGGQHHLQHAGDLIEDAEGWDNFDLAWVYTDEAETV